MASKMFQSSLSTTITLAENNLKELQDVKQLVESHLPKLESYSSSTRVKLIGILGKLFCVNCGEIYDDRNVSVGSYLCQCED